MSWTVHFLSHLLLYSMRQRFDSCLSDAYTGMYLIFLREELLFGDRTRQPSCWTFLRLLWGSRTLTLLLDMHLKSSVIWPLTASSHAPCYGQSWHSDKAPKGAMVTYVANSRHSIFIGEADPPPRSPLSLPSSCSLGLNLCHWSY